MRFATTGMYEITASGTWQSIAGIVGIMLCALAVYAGAAMTIEDVRRKTVLPLGRRGLGAASLDKSLADQLEGIEHEAGVREQL